MSAPGKPLADATPETRFAAALVELEAELDWGRLGRHYCSEGGEDFFSEEAIEALRESGLKFAADVAREVEREPRERGSLYVGAGVAELAPILLERLMLRREVQIVGLPSEESTELNRALEAVEGRLGLPLPRWSTRPLVQLARRPCAHLWLVSVLTDPDAFPALNRLAYGEARPRPKPLKEQLARAEVLVEEALSRIQPPGVVFTTDEELPLVEPAAARLGLALEVSESARLSGIVGDPVRRIRVSRLRG